MESHRGWNVKPQQFLNAGRPAANKRKLSVRIAAYAAAIGLCIWIPSKSFSLLAWLGAGAYTAQLQPILQGGGNVLAAYLLTMLIDACWKSIDRSRPRSWEQNLGPKQLHLLGVENVRIPAQQPLYGGVAPKPQIKLSPIMPLRQRATSVPGMDQSGAGPSPVAAAATAAAAAALTPQRGYLPGRRPDASPYSSSPVVTTPEQLKGFLDSWDVQTAAVEPQEVGYQPFGYPQSYEGMVSPPQAPQGAFAVRSMGTPEGLKQGLAAPTYRPSILPSRKAGVVASPDGRLRPTRDATVKEILHRLVTDQRTLEVWTERMREWLASQLLQPLVAAINAAHKDVIASAGKLGWANMQLSPLASEEGGNSAAGSRVSSAAAVEADDEVLIAQLREQLVARLRGGPQQPGNAEALACLQAVNNYQRLAYLLKGEQPRGMLPPAPRGYVVTRLQQLAEGTCVKDFSWNSGGRWQGKPWTPDLPTDSALIFYLFAAFLDAPRWQFALEDTTVAHPSSGGPLFVGSLPTRQPQAYYALLPVRPPNLSKGAMAVLGLSLGTREPHFTLVLNGEPLLTLSNYTAVFHALLLWLQSVKTAAGGIVGGRSLDYLRLAPVLKPAERNYNLFSGKWFGIWS